VIDRRRFLLTSLAGVLTVPLAAEEERGTDRRRDDESEEECRKREQVRLEKATTLGGAVATASRIPLPR
jgi:hypothetical protein